MAAAHKVAAGLAVVPTPRRAGTLRSLRPQPFLPVQQKRPAQTQRQRHSWRRAAVPEEPVASAAAPDATKDEEVFYEGSGANAELALSLLLGATLVYLPLTLASVGRRLWIKYKFTNRRLVVTTNSPALKREVQVAYKKIKEIRTAPRAFGLWGDMVVFLKDGSRLELVGLERHQELRDYMYGKMD